MLQKLCFLALCVLCTLPAMAQESRFEISGTVVDSAGVALRGATVVALALPDSTISKFAVSARDGSFTLKRVPAGSYAVQFTFVGFATLSVDLNLDADTDLGTLALEESVAELDELIVSSDHIPMVVKRDTLEYNAAAFATRPNASVEDLLRRLPGIEVENDGSIKAQGEDVQNVLVDGKEFFGGDPTIATKNLPADAVDKVQVYDKQSDMAEFTGVDDGQEEKTLNLELTEEAKQGYFGRVSGGFGDPERYDGQASINRFSATTQLSLISNINNINRQGFSVQDYIQFMGGMQSLMTDGGMRLGGGGIQLGSNINDGFSETLAIGLNANRDFNSKTSVRSSYFLSSVDNVQDRTVQQQQLLGASVSSLVADTSGQISDNRMHRASLYVEHEVEDGHDIRLRSNFNVSSSSLSNQGLRYTFGSDGLTRNTSSTGYLADGTDLGGDARLTWRKRMGESGRSLVAEYRANLNDSDVEGDLTARTGLFEPGDVVTYDELVQQQQLLGNTLQQTATLSLTLPFSGGRAIVVRGERRQVNEDQDKSIYDLAGGTRVFNDLLSSAFDRTYTYLRGGLRYRHNQERFSWGLGLDVQESSLGGVIAGTDVDIENGYTHLLPSANLNFEIRQGMNIDLRYTASTREPSMTELQPFADNRDPLNVYVGNPGLKPEYRHSLNLHYMFFDQFSFTNLFAFARATYTQNKIVRARTVDEQFRQTVTSENADGDFALDGSVEFGTPIRPIGAKINLSNRAMFTRGREFVNAEENRSQILRNTVELRLENRDKERFDLSAGSRFAFNNVDYSLNEQLSRSYVNRTLFGDATVYLGETWTLSSSVNYRAYAKEVFGETENVALLEASISKTVLNDRIDIQLIGLDLLDQNRGINFSNSATYIQEERIASLGRYVMLKLVYRLSGFGQREGRGGVMIDVRGD